jgi:hypothetical protein
MTVVVRDSLWPAAPVIHRDVIVMARRYLSKPGGVVRRTTPTSWSGGHFGARAALLAATSHYSLPHHGNASRAELIIFFRFVFYRVHTGCH